MTQRILIDHTNIFLFYSTTGILRTIRNIYRNLELLEVEVIPVYLSEGKIYTFDKKNELIVKLAKGRDRSPSCPHMQACGSLGDQALPITFSSSSNNTFHNTSSSYSKNSATTSLLRNILYKAVEKLPYQLIYFVYRKKLEKLAESKIKELVELKNLSSNDILCLADSSWTMNIWKSLEYVKQKGVKIAPIIYDLIPINHPEMVKGCFNKVFREWLNKLYKYSNHFIAISQTVSEELKEYYKKNNLDITSKHIFSFPLGSDIPQYSTSNIQHSPSPIPHPLYLTVGKLEPRKNYDFLLDAFEELWEKGINVKLLIIGKDSGKCQKTVQRIKCLTSHASRFTNLFWFDNLDDNALSYYYKNSKALIFPSIVEGFGLPIVEALSHGLPIVASDIPIFHEVGKDMIDYFSLESTDELVKNDYRY